MHKNKNVGMEGNVVEGWKIGFSANSGGNWKLIKSFKQKHVWKAPSIEKKWF